jgi:hypothetical protein
MAGAGLRLGEFSAGEGERDLLLGGESSPEILLQENSRRLAPLNHFSTQGL